MGRNPDIQGFYVDETGHVERSGAWSIDGNNFVNFDATDTSLHPEVFRTFTLLQNFFPTYEEAVRRSINNAKRERDARKLAVVEMDTQIREYERTLHAILDGTIDATTGRYVTTMIEQDDEPDLLDELGIVEVDEL